MKIVTTPTIEGYKVTKVIGVGSGSTVRAKNVGRDIIAAFKNLVGGEIIEYSKLMAESREQAMDRMVKNAEDLGADAVVCVRFTTSMLQQGASEIFIYGTAVKL